MPRARATTKEIPSRRGLQERVRPVTSTHQTRQPHVAAVGRVDWQHAQEAQKRSLGSQQIRLSGPVLLSAYGGQGDAPYGGGLARVVFTEPGPTGLGLRQAADGRITVAEIPPRARELCREVSKAALMPHAADDTVAQ